LLSACMHEITPLYLISPFYCHFRAIAYPKQVVVSYI
jgi:hypothetical protein